MRHAWGVLKEHAVNRKDKSMIRRLIPLLLSLALPSVTSCTGTEKARVVLQADAAQFEDSRSMTTTALSLNVPVILFKSGGPAIADDFFDSLAEPLEVQIQRLEIVRDFLVKNPQVKVQIMGFTDGLECRGLYCKKLSAERAEAVRNWMIRNGVNAKSIAGTEGHGTDYPLADDATGEGSQSNRRLEFLLIFPNQSTD